MNNDRFIYIYNACIPDCRNTLRRRHVDLFKEKKCKSSEGCVVSSKEEKVCLVLDSQVTVDRVPSDVKVKALKKTVGCLNA